MKRLVLKKLLASVLGICLLFSGAALAGSTQTITLDASAYTITQNGSYTTMEEVAVYLSVYSTLPSNFISKQEAQLLGWSSSDGNLWQVAPGMSIGGDRFGNYEKALPTASGRQWTECDIDSDGGYRNAKRIVFSNDGLIYYTEDHYNHFAQVVVSGEPDHAAVNESVAFDGWYTTKDDVAAYLKLYGVLPSNYITREQAKALGWNSKKDNLGDVAPGYAIGGDSFGNREGLLPDAQGRTWLECDVNMQAGRRSSERLVWSNDGLIFFTPDNHQSFIQVY